MTVAVFLRYIYYRSYFLIVFRSFFVPFKLTTMASFSSPTVRKKLKATVPSNPQPSEEIDLVPAEGGTQLALVDAAKSSKRGREDNNEVELRSQTELALSDFASGIFRRSGLGSSHVFECRFRSHFGASPGVAARCWDLLQEGELTDLHTMDRFLWALMLLMNYATEEVNAIKASGVDKGTFSKWAWDFVERIADLESVVIVWENRKQKDELNDCLTSVDGSDFRYEITLRQFSSYKLKKKGGLRYLVVLCIKTGHIVFIDGPFPAGLYNDIKCFRWSLIHFLEENERVEADDGFIGECPKHCKCPGSFVAEDEKAAMQSNVRACHEHVNKRMKQFGCLRQQFRHHNFDKHAICFRAVAVLSQLAIEAGEPLWQVEYSDLDTIES